MSSVLERAQAVAAGLIDEETETKDAVLPVIEEILNRPEVATTEPNDNIFERAICLSVALSKWGTSRKIAQSKVTLASGGALDPKFTSTTKKLLRCQEYKAIVGLDGTIGTFLKSRTLPSRLFRSGVYLLPVELAGEVDDRLVEFATKRQQLVEALGAVLTERINEARVALGEELWDRNDYPANEVILGEFAMAFEYLTYGVPKALERVRSDIMKRETAKAARKIQDDVALITEAMRVSLKTMLTHAVDRLTSDADGKPKRFHYTMIEKLDDFLTTFRSRNIVQDASLEALVDQARELLTGVDPESIRKNGDVRDMLKEGFDRINATLDTMVVVTPGRQYVNDDDDADDDVVEAA